MIPAIGIMMGCYILTRMVSFMTRKGENSEDLLVKSLSMVTVFITILCIGVLIYGPGPAK